MNSGYDGYPTGLFLVEQPAVSSDFVIVREEIQRMSEEAGELQRLGVLRTPENAHAWRGSISRKARVAPGGELHGKEALVAETEARLKEFFVATTKGAAKRCVDGRTRVGYGNNDPASYGALLGPQEQGGTTEEVVAYRYIKGPQGATTLAADVRQYIATHRSDYAPGNHVSDRLAPGCTGCGNLDSQKERAPWYGDDEIAPVVQAHTAAIMGAAGLTPTPGAFEAMRDNAAELRHTAPNYYDNLEAVVTEIKTANANGIETLSKDHNETTVTINLVPQTTFHRDAYNALTDGLIQNFNLDAWHIFDEHPPEVAEAIVNDTVATLLRLTDGSLDVYLRTPAAQQ